MKKIKKGDINTKWPQPFLGFWAWNFAGREVFGSHFQKYRRLMCFLFWYRVSRKDGKYEFISKMYVTDMEYHTGPPKYLYFSHYDQYLLEFSRFRPILHFLGHPAVSLKKIPMSFWTKNLLPHQVWTLYLQYLLRYRLLLLTFT